MHSASPRERLGDLQGAGMGYINTIVRRKDDRVDRHLNHADSRARRIAGRSGSVRHRIQ